VAGKSTTGLSGGVGVLTARAAGNLHSHPERQQSASSLAAKGFGSTTFRPKASQLVTARSTWQDGRWTVVLRRPLQVRPEDGISLAAGGQCSVAFALWDGEARDRSGQKLISIWHDLKID
jgi:DMSO reductase family type II enzyme heme b subunit